MAGSIGTATVQQSAGGFESRRMTFTTDSGAGTLASVAVELRPGYLISAEVIPVTSGGTQPTNLFDLTLLDGDSLDLLGGRGANCVNTGPTLFPFSPPLPWVGGSVYPTLAAAGNSKVGEFVFVVDYND